MLRSFMTRCGLFLHYSIPDHDPFTQTDSVKNETFCFLFFASFAVQQIVTHVINAFIYLCISIYGLFFCINFNLIDYTVFFQYYKRLCLGSLLDLIKPCT